MNWVKIEKPNHAPSMMNVPHSVATTSLSPVEKNEV